MFKDLTNLITKRDKLAIINDSFTKRLEIYKINRQLRKLAKRIARDNAKKIYRVTLDACQALIKK
jgi:hypothetical protein